MGTMAQPTVNAIVNYYGYNASISKVLTNLVPHMPVTMTINLLYADKTLYIAVAEASATNTGSYTNLLYSANMGTGTYTFSFVPTQSNVEMKIDYPYFNTKPMLCFTLDSVNYKQQTGNGTSTQLVQISNKLKGGYRFGYGNHEKIDEIAGAGNTIDMGDRWLDTRIGRTPKTDAHKFKYPSFSPYSFVANNPIYYIDPDGRDFIKSIISVYTLGAPKVIHDLAGTNYNPTKWYSASFNNKTSEFDIKLNFQVAYSKFFKQQYDNNGIKTTLDGENPDLFNQVKAHEEGHVDQMFEQASQANLKVTFEFDGLKKTYLGQADNILTNIYKDYKKAGKVGSINDFNKKVQPWAEYAVITELSKVISKAYPNEEADANKRAEMTNGKPKYGVVDDKNNTNIKFKGTQIKATQNE
jgi:hypothetical protein